MDNGEIFKDKGEDVLSANELEVPRDEAGEQAGESEDPILRKERLAQKIQRMAAGEKIRLSMRAGKEVRSILIKDPNKQVVLGVISNPKMTIPEVEMAARMRSLPEEALREISKNKEWIKNYGVVYNLVTNAKTPPGLAVSFLPRLKPKDLGSIRTNKEISEAVRTAARRLAEARDKTRGGAG